MVKPDKNKRYIISQDGKTTVQGMRYSNDDNDGYYLFKMGSPQVLSDKNRLDFDGHSMILITPDAWEQDFYPFEIIKVFDALAPSVPIEHDEPTVYYHSEED